ncbi:hypothetical protein NX059_003102 [Plenodomus lindquistii]|nr:hypothetical protein NX059_003102 [Plenodomus lindquistii]
MEALPLELRIEILSYLLPHVDLAAVKALPVYVKKERESVYNARLVSHAINVAASQAFVHIVELHPTQSAESSMQNLANLVELDRIGKQITCLTFDHERLMIKDEDWAMENLSTTVLRGWEGFDHWAATTKTHQEDQIIKLRHLVQTRKQWLEERFASMLMTILHRTPRIRHWIDRVRLVAYDRLDEFELDTDELTASVSLPDPFHLIICVLEQSGLSAQIEGATLLTEFGDSDIEQSMIFDTPSLKTNPPLFPKNLRHLTLHCTHFLLADFDVSSCCPDLTSFQLVVDTYVLFRFQDLVETLARVSFPPGLQSYKISVVDYEIPDHFLWAIINRITEGFVLLPTLTLKDVLMEDGWGELHEFDGPGRFQKLVLDNVSLYDSEEFSVLEAALFSGLDDKYKLLPLLVGRADGVYSMDGSKMEYPGKKPRAYIEIESDDAFESDDEFESDDD